MVNKPPITKFCVILRGRTDWEDQGLIQGRTDRPLHLLGVEEAQMMRDKLANLSFAAVITGDQSSSRTSTDIIVEGKDLDYIIDPLLRERDWGEWEGQSFQELKERHPIDFKRMFFPNHLSTQAELSKNLFHEAENFTLFGERIYRCIRETAKEYVGEMVLVVMGRQALLALLIMMGLAITDLKKQSVFFIYVENGICRLAKAREANVQSLDISRFW